MASSIQVSSYDFASAAREHGMLHRGLERDDHDAASLLPMPDGTIAAFYTRHDGFDQMRWRVSDSSSLAAWGPERSFAIDIAQVPSPIFFATVTFLAAFIPAVGAAVVSLVAAFLLYVTGHPYVAIFLAVWGLVIVGLVDNVIKPLLIKRGMEIHGVVVFFAFVGGGDPATKVRCAAANGKCHT